MAFQALEDALQAVRNRLSRVEKRTTPVASITAYAGATAPSGWLLCNGAAVSRSTYAELFSVLGTSYGSGNGSTTFNLPNLVGRVPVGRDAAQSEFDALGEVGGAKSHTLTEAEIPSHTHTQNAHTHANALTSATVASSGHVHNLDTATAHAHVTATGTELRIQSRSVAAWTADRDAALTTPASTDSNNFGARLSGDTASPSSTTTVGITNASQTAINQATGGGQSHNNLQPYLTVNYIIRAD